MVIEATRSMMNGSARPREDSLVRGAQAQAPQNGAHREEDALFTCPDRDAAGFVPSSR
jgi:hypothetical protein